MYLPNELISRSYVDAQKYLHAQPKGYGQRGRKWAEAVQNILVAYDAWSVLDYGCGTGSLMQALAVRGVNESRMREYDPAILGKDERPVFADCVVCTDVMEHVEPDKVQNVAKHLAQLTRKVCFVVVSLVETAKILPDGRQAHISLHPVEFWQELFGRFFTIEAEPQIKPEKQWVAVLCPK